ncbi:MAG: LON peptidase substrate-binding domain-containing protein [bacterium]
MINPADLPEIVPLFPLAGAVLLPRARLPLHVFEPRYLALIEDCLKSDRRLIGMIQPRGDQSEPLPGLATVGCAGRMTSFSETDDGRYMVTLTGVARFMVREELTGFVPYRRARVDFAPYLHDLTEPQTDPGLDRRDFLKDLARYLKASKMGTDWSNLKEADDEMLVNVLSMLCPFAPEEKQALLEAVTLPERRKILQTLIAFSLQSHGAGEETLQ